MHGPSWRVTRGAPSGTSHAAAASRDRPREHLLSHPIDLCLSGSELRGWPSLALTLTQVEPLRNRELSIAHAHTHIPNSPGMHSILCNAWSPRPLNSGRQTSKPHVLSQLSFTRWREGISLSTIGSGTVRLRLGVVVNRLHLVPIHLPSKPEHEEKEARQADSPKGLQQEIADGKQQQQQKTELPDSGVVLSPLQARRRARIQGQTQRQSPAAGSPTLPDVTSEGSGAVTSSKEEQSGTAQSSGVRQRSLLDQYRQRRQQQRDQSQQEQADESESNPTQAVHQSLDLESEQRERHRELEEQWESVRIRRKPREDE